MGFGDFMDKMKDKVEDVLDDLKPLSAEEQREMGVRGLRDALRWALSKALDWGMEDGNWLEERVKLHVPGLRKILHVNEKARSVPIIGDQLSQALMGEVEKVEVELRDGAVTTASDHRTRDCFVDAITRADPSNILDIIREGGMTGFVDYLKAEAVQILKTVLRERVRDAIDDRRVTRSWISLQDKYNTVAEKVPGCEPLETDLVEYVVDKSVDGLLCIMSDRERELRESPHKAASQFVEQILSGVDPANWKRIKLH